MSRCLQAALALSCSYLLRSPEVGVSGAKQAAIGKLCNEIALRLIAANDAGLLKLEVHPEGLGIDMVPRLGTALRGNTALRVLDLSAISGIGSESRLRAIITCTGTLATMLIQTLPCCGLETVVTGYAADDGISRCYEPCTNVQRRRPSQTADHRQRCALADTGALAVLGARGESRACMPQQKTTTV